MIMDSPKGALIKNLLKGPGFTSAERALSGITQEQATTKPGNSPHSIADILAHLNFWQSWALSAIDGKPKPMPAHAAEGWVGMTGSWDDLTQEFLAGLDKAKTLTEDETLLQKPFDPETKIGWGFEKHSVGEVIVDVIAVHHAHHLGQIILLRRMLNVWPPEGGGSTW
jgi:uncharacterized damage-inducible protein DinB